VFAAVVGAHLLKEAFAYNDIPDYSVILERIGITYSSETK
jgi:hypothetical protein